MNIAYGVTAFQKTTHFGGTDGIGEYTIQLLGSLRQRGEVKPVPVSFFPTDAEGTLTDTAALGAFKQQMLAASLVGRSFAAERALPAGIELFHATDHYIPRLRHLPVVATIHDVIPFSYPQWFSPLQRAYHAFLRRSMRWADHIITVSDYSKQEICRVLKRPPNDITVVHNSFDPAWTDQDSAAWIKTVRHKHGITRPYIIFVGTIQKRKNLDALISAMARLPAATANTVELVVVGKPAKHDAGENKKLQQLVDAKKARWLYYVASDELRTLVRGAQCLVFPSLAEGFGIPVIEAFAAGTPVIASNATSIPEVAGDAAKLFSPDAPDQLTEALTAVLADPALRAQMIDRGKARASDFSWNRSAEATMAVYRQVIDQHQGRRN